MSKKNKNKAPNGMSRFQIGNGVFHKDYGEGEIIASGLADFFVRFDNDTSKKLRCVTPDQLESRPKRGQYRIFRRGR